MKPIGPLMREHRLIERMLGIIDHQVDRLKLTGEIDRSSLSQIVDFFRTYADQTHHGKEEDILFQVLETKKLTVEHRRILAELIKEHQAARLVVSNLSDELQKTGSSVEVVLLHLSSIRHLYPVHIEKEDKQFFYPCLDYLSDAEQKTMLDSFWEFDRQMIHRKYETLVDNLINLAPK